MTAYSKPQTQSMPIAIIGMACRFSGGATSPSKLWDLCAAGRDGWSGIPQERFDVKSLYDADSEKIGRSHVKGGYFLQDDISCFDAGFFNLTADVASTMDPQIRHLLEIVYEATEDAGIPLDRLAGSNTSVFSGCFGTDYQGMLLRDPETVPTSFLTSSWTTMFANRVSHFFDLQGASMTIDTGCSAGLVALHQGCQTIRSGQSNMSIVGASALLLSQDLFIAGSSIGVIGEQGRCYAWDHRAQGYGRGEGATALILKPLDAAIRDGDRVHAVIRETHLNQDGKTTTITSPSMDAQVRLIEDCYERAGLDIAHTGYVEAHMTGTKVGDATEAEAIAKTFGKKQVSGLINVGSVKTNIGHTEPVSGLAAVIKSAFSLKNRQIAPNLNYEETNPMIKLNEWHLQVPTQLTSWPQDKLLRASVNSFGYGGTNAHIILEATSVQPRIIDINSLNGTNGVNGYHKIQNGTRDRHGSRVYVLSAKDPAVCQEMGKNLATHLRGLRQEGQMLSPDDLAFTLAERRSRLPWVASIRAGGIEQLVEDLEKPTMGPSHAAKQPRIGLVFNGQGAQWHAMGRELLSEYPVFRSSIEEANQVFKNYGADWSLYDELMRDERSTRVAEVNLSQPMSVALQLCLVNLLASWGVSPSAVTSHSSGEISAAYAAGVLSFKEALGVVYFRGELALKHQKLTPLAGGMLAAGIGPIQAEEYIKDTTGGRVVVACINSPESVTLSGDLPALEEVASRLEKDGLFSRRLKVPLAYHSHHMSPMEKDYIDVLQSILPEQRKAGKSVVFASPVTGSVIPPESLKPEHWARNLTSPVCFSQAFESMCSSDAKVDMIVEVGAHGALAGPIRQILNGRKMPYVSCLKRSADAVETMQDLACELVARGYPVDLSAVNRPSGNETVNFVADLPTYPWNHSTSYWVESRVDKESRQKPFPPHELLGLPISGSNGNTPTWRNFIRVSDLPWLADHQVDGKIVLPGAAYMSLAIEAVRTLTDASEASIHGYCLRDVNIMSALTIPESSDGVELHTCLRPCNDNELDHRGWFEFEFASVESGGSWARNCTGYISVELGTNTKSALFCETPMPSEDSFLNKGSITKAVDVESLYSSLRDMSIYHGPVFQNLLSGRTTGDRTVMDLSIPGVASETFDYVVHPTTLDTIVQAMFSGLQGGDTRGLMFLPRSIGTMFVPRALNRHSGNKLKAFVTLQKSNRRGVTSTVAVSNDGTGDSSGGILQMEGVYYQAVPLDTEPDSDSKEASICSKTHWELDIIHRIPAAVSHSMKITLTDSERGFEKKILRAAYHFIYDTVEELKSADREKWTWYHKIFYGWMEHVVEHGTSGTLSPGSRKWSRTSKGMKHMLYDELNASNACGRLIVRVGQKLASIIRGDITPLELMLEGDLLNQFYMEIPRLKHRTYKHMRQVMELYAVQSPGAKVLEIGGGTAGATSIVLEAFASRGDGSGSLLGHYTFTDISSGFFEAARQKLSAWEGMVDFKKFDIELDPTDQSFTEGSYDLIIASWVLHATKDLSKTMSHVRKLLRPGGRLVMIETTEERLDLPMIFGTLPGWWLSEEPSRKLSPNVGVKAWDGVLRETGFTGVDYDIRDCEDSDYASSSLIVATARTNPSFPSSIAIVYTETPPESWTSKLSEALRDRTGILPTIESFDCVSQLQDKVCVFAGEMTAPFVNQLDEKSFENIRHLLVNSKGVLWLSSGSIVDAKEPAFAQIQGLLRTVRQEHTSNRYVHLDFEQSRSPWTENTVDLILHVLEQSFDYSKEHSDIEWDYAVKGSALYVPRVFVDEVEDNSNVNSGPESQLFHQPGRTLVWEPSSSGLLSDPHFIENTEVLSELPSGMVQIEAKAFGLNFRDVMIALNQLDDTLVGHDCAGVVTGLGPGTDHSGLKVGDRVCAISRGRFSSSSRAYWTSTAKLPDDISYTDGAAIPLAYTTAYYSLKRIAGLRRGESVLIHAAAGGVGQAAIVVAQHLGAGEIFVTCSTEVKRDMLVNKYHIKPANIFSSRDKSFASATRRATKGKGVDVVLNSLSGPLLEASWHCVARFGRFVEIGKVDIEAARLLDMSPYGRCATYTGVDVLQLNEYDGPSTYEALVESVRICHAQAIHENMQPMYPIKEYSISEMEYAMRQMQSGAHVGKLVLVPNDGDRVEVISHPRPHSLTNDNATYLVVGGLGGIGRAVAMWMIDKGAKHILLVSRNAESHPDAADLVKVAEDSGCDLQVKNCDVSNESSLVELLRSCPTPVKGVINAAMVLDDTIFERMTFEQWQHAVQPKVSSSINLHKHLPSLDFFVMLSSLSGVVGHTSQANYASGNTFQDALARARAASGQPGVSLDLGAIASVGYVAASSDAERNAIHNRVKALGATTLDISAIMRVIEGAVLGDPHHRGARPDDAQVIVGLAPWDALPEDAAVRQDHRFGTLRLASPRGLGGAAGRATAAAGGGGPADISPTSMLVQALGGSLLKEAARPVAEAVAARLAVIFNVSPETVDLGLPVSAHGVDSLVAVELRNWLSRAAKAKLSIFEILQSHSLLDFGALIVEKSQALKT